MVLSRDQRPAIRAGNLGEHLGTSGCRTDNVGHDRSSRTNRTCVDVPITRVAATRIPGDDRTAQASAYRPIVLDRRTGEQIVRLLSV